LKFIYSGNNSKEALMSRFQDSEKVGLRDKKTKKLIAVYPNKIEGTDNEIEDKVKFWYYQQSCSAEEKLRDSFVDSLTIEELKSINTHL
jgi:hypothetical protein